MATWPNSSKASTQYTDQPSDRIADARAEINQTIANQSEIIDMFNIPESPVNGYILSYDTDTDRFEMVKPIGDITVVSHDTALTTDFVGDSAGYGSYNGGFTFTVTGNSNIIIGSNASASTLTIPAGTYNFDSEKISWTYYSGGSNDTTLTGRVYADGVLVGSMSQTVEVVVSGPYTTVSWRFSGEYTFDTDAEVHFEYDADGVNGFVYFALPDLQITLVE
jgi:hypothetical protein